MSRTNATSDEPTVGEKRKIFDEMVIKARLSRQAAGMVTSTSGGGRAAPAASDGRVEDTRIVTLARQYIDEQWAAKQIEIDAAQALDHIRATVDPAQYTSAAETESAAPPDEHVEACTKVDHAGVRRARRYMDEMHAKGISVSAQEALEHVGVSGS